MQVSSPAKSTMAIFRILQKLNVIDKAEEFDRFYVWVEEVEGYVETYAIH